METDILYRVFQIRCSSWQFRKRCKENTPKDVPMDDYFNTATEEEEEEDSDIKTKIDEANDLICRVKNALYTIKSLTSAASGDSTSLSSTSIEKQHIDNKLEDQQPPLTRSQIDGSFIRSYLNQILFEAQHITAQIMTPGELDEDLTKRKGSTSAIESSASNLERPVTRRNEDEETVNLEKFNNQVPDEPSTSEKATSEDFPSCTPSFETLQVKLQAISEATESDVSVLQEYCPVDNCGKHDKLSSTSIRTDTSCTLTPKADAAGSKFPQLGICGDRNCTSGFEKDVGRQLSQTVTSSYRQRVQLLKPAKRGSSSSKEQDPQIESELKDMAGQTSQKSSSCSTMEYERGLRSSNTESYADECKKCLPSAKMSGLSQEKVLLIHSDFTRKPTDNQSRSCDQKPSEIHGTQNYIEQSQTDEVIKTNTVKICECHSSGAGKQEREIDSQERNTQTSPCTPKCKENQTLYGINSKSIHAQTDHRVKVKVTQIQGSTDSDQLKTRLKQPCPFDENCRPTATPRGTYSLSEEYTQLFLPKTDLTPSGTQTRSSVEKVTGTQTSSKTCTLSGTQTDNYGQAGTATQTTAKKISLTEESRSTVSWFPPLPNLEAANQEPIQIIAEKQPKLKIQTMPQISIEPIKLTMQNTHHYFIDANGTSQDLLRNKPKNVTYVEINDPTPGPERPSKILPKDTLQIDTQPKNSSAREENYSGASTERTQRPSIIKTSPRDVMHSYSDSLVLSIPSSTQTAEPGSVSMTNVSPQKTDRYENPDFHFLSKHLGKKSLNEEETERREMVFKSYNLRDNPNSHDPEPLGVISLSKLSEMDMKFYHTFINPHGFRPEYSLWSGKQDTDKLDSSDTTDKHFISDKEINLMAARSASSFKNDSYNIWGLLCSKSVQCSALPVNDEELLSEFLKGLNEEEELEDLNKEEESQDVDEEKVTNDFEYDKTWSVKSTGIKDSFSEEEPKIRKDQIFEKEEIQIQTDNFFQEEPKILKESSHEEEITIQKIDSPIQQRKWSQTEGPLALVADEKFDEEHDVKDDPKFNQDSEIYRPNVTRELSVESIEKISLTISYSTSETVTSPEESLVIPSIHTINMNKLNEGNISFMSSATSEAKPVSSHGSFKSEKFKELKSKLQSVDVDASRPVLTLVSRTEDDAKTTIPLFIKGLVPSLKTYDEQGLSNESVVNSDVAAYRQFSKVLRVDKSSSASRNGIVPGKKIDKTKDVTSENEEEEEREVREHIPEKVRIKESTPPSYTQFPIRESLRNERKYSINLPAYEPMDEEKAREDLKKMMENVKKMRRSTSSQITDVSSSRMLKTKMERERDRRQTNSKDTTASSEEQTRQAIKDVLSKHISKHRVPKPDSRLEIRTDKSSSSDNTPGKSPDNSKHDTDHTVMFAHIEGNLIPDISRYAQHLELASNGRYKDEENLFCQKIYADQTKPNFRSKKSSTPVNLPAHFALESSTSEVATNRSESVSEGEVKLRCTHSVSNGEVHVCSRKKSNRNSEMRKRNKILQSKRFPKEPFVKLEERRTLFDNWVTYYVKRSTDTLRDSTSSNSHK